MENNSFNVSTVDRHKNGGAQTEQVPFNADNNAGKKHDADKSNALHRDWGESSGIALPTVEELHYAHHFLNRAAERRLK